MSAGPPVREMAAGEESHVTEVLADAFQRETLAIWIEADPVLRRASFRVLFRDLLKVPAEGRVVDVTTDLGAAAIWYSPGRRRSLWTVQRARRWRPCSPRSSR